MNNWVFFALVFLVNVIATSITYSSWKSTKLGLAMFILVGVLGSVVWLLTVKTIKSPNQILMMGFTADIIGKAAAIGLPFLLFGAKADPKAMVGLGFMAVGVYIAK